MKTCPLWVHHSSCIKGESGLNTSIHCSLLFICVYVYSVCMHTYAIVLMWHVESKDNLQEVLTLILHLAEACFLMFLLCTSG